ncbi:MAG: type I methionyl aminopeptidase [Planctomycetaceae bacterium]|nr:type I methionyl aminopeptidase [Planctomycetaceae bacterium]
MLNLRSNREIKQLRQAGLVVWQAHQAVAERVAAGTTTAELDDAVEAIFARVNAIPLFKGVPGKTPFPAATCTSVNEEIVHGIPGNRVLKAGDIVSVDTGCKVNGWCGDSAQTYPVGQIDSRSQQLLEVTSGALDLAIELLTKEPTWSRIARQMQDYVESAGFSVVKEFVGHGIGRELHEKPQVPNFWSENTSKSEDFQLKTGLVLAIEPMVNAGSGKSQCLADHWTQATIDGERSAHFEHTVALTADGPLRLTGPPMAGEGLPAE